MVVFILPLFLMFLGVKVPNVSHIHTPKPMSRAVLEAPAGKPVQYVPAKHYDAPAGLSCPIYPPLLPASPQPVFPVVVMTFSCLVLLGFLIPRAPPIPSYC